MKNQVEEYSAIRGMLKDGKEAKIEDMWKVSMELPPEFSKWLDEESIKTTYDMLMKGFHITDVPKELLGE